MTRRGSDQSTASPDPLTHRVRQLYSQYPFPNADYRLDYGLQLMRFFSQLAPSGKRSFLENAKILDAGCGTGNAITQLAKQFPSSVVWAIDLTPASIAIARKNAASRGVSNVSFRVESILTMDLGEHFDVILSFGVLHHLPDMSLGIRNMARHLAPGGYLVLWLYGKYGRFRLNLNQAMFRILFKDVESLETKVELTKRALGTFPRKLVECHFNAPRTEIEDDFERSLEFAFENEAWLVDQFLHVNEQTLDMREILDLLTQSGLRMARWLSVNQKMEAYTQDRQLIDLFEKLAPEDQLACLDLLVKPNYYLVVARKE